MIRKRLGGGGGELAALASSFDDDDDDDGADDVWLVSVSVCCLVGGSFGWFFGVTTGRHSVCGNFVADGVMRMRMRLMVMVMDLDHTGSTDCWHQEEGRG